MKKFSKLMALAIAVTMSISVIFTGCGPSNEKSPADATGTAGESAATTTTEATTSKPADLNAEIKVLTYAHAADGKDSFTKSLDESVKNLNKNFPGIKIKWVNVPYGEYENKVRLALSSGTGADIIWVDTPNLASYAANGALTPLDEYWDPSDYDDLLDSSKQAMKYNGKIYAAPLNEANLCLFYNKDLTDKAGITPPKTVAEAWTWEQFYEAAKKLTEKDANGKVKVYGASPSMTAVTDVNEGSTFGLISWIWQGGGEILSEDGTKATGVFDSTQNIETLKFFQKFYTEGIAPKQAIANGFETGKVAMFFVGPWEFGYLKEKFPKFNVGTTPLPRNVQAGSPTGSWDMAITSQCKEPQAAWEYIKQVTGKEDSKKRTDLTGDLPARKSVLEQSEQLKTELFQPIKDQLMNGAKPRPVSPVYPKISEALTKAFNDVAFGKDPAETVKKYADIMQKAIDGK